MGKISRGKSARQVRLDRSGWTISAWKDQPMQLSQERSTLTGPLEQVNLDRTKGKSQKGQIIRDRSACWRGHLGQSAGKVTKAGQPGQDSQDSSAWTHKPGRSAWTVSLTS
jgi:hypothetical protein